MKKNAFFLLLSIVLILGGCSKNNSNGNNNPLSPLTGGTNNGGTVTFQIRSEAGQNSETEFDAQPSENCTITEIDVTETTGTNFTDTIQGDGTTVYQAGTWYLLANYTGVQSGLKFTFEFIGKTSPAGAGFDVTSNYTVP